MKIEGPNTYVCDLCGSIQTSIHYPTDFIQMYIRLEHSGFFYSRSIEVCGECAGPEFFKDPESKEEFPVSKWRQFLSALKLKPKKGLVRD